LPPLAWLVVAGVACPWLLATRSGGRRNDRRGDAAPIGRTTCYGPPVITALRGVN